VAGSGTARLTFTYTVQSGDNAAHLQVTLLDLDGASIKDDAGASLPTAVTAYLDLTIDTVAPTITIGQLVDDTGASSTDLITSDGHVTLSGNVADANGISSVEVFDGKTDLGAATIDHGTWSYSALFGEGSHTLSAVATDWAGNSTATAAQPTFLVDTTPPVPVLLNAAFDQFSGSTTLKGVSEAQSNVSVFDAGVFVGITKAAADGTWSLQTSIVGKTVQTYTESATDLAGNTGSSPGVALLYEQRSNQSLVGGDGNDVLVANHMDTLTGGAGSDTFVFNPGFGKATITDFNVSQDVLLLDHSLFSTPTGSQVLAQSHDVTTGMVISFNPANTITLTGVHMADLQAHPSDFHLF
jgi:hypothetical protein